MVSKCGDIYYHMYILVRFSSGFVWLNSGLFQQRLALLDLSRSKQWRSHSSRTCTDRFIESQAPDLAWGCAVAYRSSWLHFSLATSPRSHGIIATAAHSPGQNSNSRPLASRMSKCMHGMNQTEAEYPRHSKRSQTASLSLIGPLVLEI